MAEIVSNTISEPWDKLLHFFWNVKKRPVIAVVLGGSDRGKSSFATYMSNRLAEKKFKVAI